MLRTQPTPTKKDNTLWYDSVDIYVKLTGCCGKDKKCIVICSNFVNWTTLSWNFSFQSHQSSAKKLCNEKIEELGDLTKKNVQNWFLKVRSKMVYFAPKTAAGSKNESRSILTHTSFVPSQSSVAEDGTNMEEYSMWHNTVVRILISSVKVSSSIYWIFYHLGNVNSTIKNFL
jgi:hypothetical protein